MRKYLNPKSKTIVLLLCFILGAVFVKYFFLTTKPPAYLTAKVMRGDLESVVMTTGVLQAKQLVDVGARVSGQVQSLLVKLGDHVEKGQLLAVIDPVLANNAYLSALANLKSLEAQRRATAANFWQANLAYKRQLEMISQDATSRQEVEMAQSQRKALLSNLASYDAQLSELKTQVNSALTNLGYTKIVAPMSGHVVAIVTQEGQTVIATQQAPVILKLANLDRLTVKAKVSEADVIRIHPGQPAYFTILGDSAERHYSEVGTIEPAPESFSLDSTKEAEPIFYNALFDIDNPGHRLRIAMTAQVTVVLKEAKNALHIPLSALGKASGDGRFAVRLIGKDGKISTRNVATGINDNVRVQVLDNLKEGEEVIIEESDKEASPGNI